TVFILSLPVAGALGAANKGYDFQQEPDKALETIARLNHLSTGQKTLAPDEVALMADVANGELKKFSFAEAALLASGITDATKRKFYLSRIDQIEASARSATAGATTPAGKGESLLKFLHAGPMKAGYARQQTSLAVLLDTGKYNC